MSTLIAIPCMDMVHTPFFQSTLALWLNDDVSFGISSGSLIYDARNSLAQRAVQEGHDRILWLDSDMVFGQDLLERLTADMDEGRDFVSGLYFKRRNPIRPVVYKDYGFRQEGENVVSAYATYYEDYPKNSVFEIAACGFGAVLMKTELVKSVQAEFGAPFSPHPGFGEDLSFCLRARQQGVKLYCDSRIKLGHIAQSVVTEEVYERRVKL